MEPVQALEWEDFQDSSRLELPIGRISISPRYDFATGAILNYSLQLEDGQEGASFRIETVAVTDMPTLKQQAIQLLRETMQATLELLDNG